MKTYETIGLVEVKPQIGFNNIQQDSGLLLPFLAGVIVGIFVKNWFL